MIGLPHVLVDVKTWKYDPCNILYLYDGGYCCITELLFVVSEFIPYVFQVLALMLEMHAEGAVSPPYLALFPHLLLPVLWSRDGNIPPLVRLLQAYISRGIRQIESDKLASVYRCCFSERLCRLITDHFINFTSFCLVVSSLFHWLVRTSPHACQDLPNTAII